MARLILLDMTREGEGHVEEESGVLWRWRGKEQRRKLPNPTRRNRTSPWTHAISSLSI